MWVILPVAKQQQQWIIREGGTFISFKELGSKMWLEILESGGGTH